MYLKEIFYYLTDISKEFDLVMITDYMLESLILLRHDLCMTLDDICFFSKNVASNGSKPKIGNDDRETMIKNWQHLDVQV